MKIVYASLIVLISSVFIAQKTWSEQPKSEATMSVYQEKLNSLRDWQKTLLENKNQGNEDSKDLIKSMPLTLEDIQSAIQVYQSHSSSAEGLDALQLVYFSSRIAKGAPQEVALEHSAEARNLVLEHHADNPNTLNIFRSVTFEQDGISFLEAAFKKSASREVQKGIAEALIASVASPVTMYLPDDEKQEKIAIGTKYAQLYLDELTTDKNSEQAKRAKGFLFYNRELGVGHTIPDMMFSNLDGDIEQVSDYAGKVLLIDFWATWCKPCVASIPHIDKMNSELDQNTFQMISVSADQTAEDVIDFRDEKHAMPWVNWIATPESGIIDNLGISAFPTYLVIDPSGVILMKSHNFDDVEPLIRKLVTEAKHT